MKRYRRALAAFLLCIVLAGTFAGTAAAIDAPAEDASAGAYLYNIENDKVLLAHKAQNAVYPTSTVKIMTGILAIEHFGDAVDTQITVTKEMLAKTSGNSIGLVAGEVVTVRDMLYGMICGGANDAAYVLAHAVAGSDAEFVRRMNERAAELGATLTYYKNPTGIHDEAMVTTAEDTARIALCAYRLPLFMEIAGTAKYTMPATNLKDARNFYNKNSLISPYGGSAYVYKYAIGMNAGSTYAGGFCVVGVAEHENLTYLCVVMGGKQTEDKKFTSYTEAIRLFDAAFEEYGYTEVLKETATVREIPVELSNDADYVTVVPAKPVSVYLHKDVSVESEFSLSYQYNSDTLTAPVEKGQVVGTVSVLRGDEVVETVDLVTTSAVSRSDFLAIMQEIRHFATSRFFIITVVCFVLISVGYLVIKTRLEKKRRNTTWYRK